LLGGREMEAKVRNLRMELRDKVCCLNMAPYEIQACMLCKVKRVNV
jgi:hypothetical protein